MRTRNLVLGLLVGLALIGLSVGAVSAVSAHGGESVDNDHPMDHPMNDAMMDGESPMEEMMDGTMGDDGTHEHHDQHDDGHHDGEMGCH